MLKKILEREKKEKTQMRNIGGGGGGQILSKPHYLSTLQSILYKPIAYFKFAKEVRELNRELALKRKG